MAINVPGFHLFRYQPRGQVRPSQTVEDTGK